MLGRQDRRDWVDGMGGKGGILGEEGGSMLWAVFSWRGHEREIWFPSSLSKQRMGSPVLQRRVIFFSPPAQPKKIHCGIRAFTREVWFPLSKQRMGSPVTVFNLLESSTSLVWFPLLGKGSEPSKSSPSWQCTTLVGHVPRRAAWLLVIQYPQRPAPSLVKQDIP